MDTRELLMHLEQLEIGLDSFSFTELKTAEASELRKSFQSFKNGLEEKVFGAPPEMATQENNQRDATSAPSSSESKLIANVSHEIRTPLNGIIGFLDLLKETSLSNQQSELVRAMDSASRNLLDLINGILEFSKLASGQEKFEKLPFSPSNLVNEIAFLSKTLINGKDVEFLVDFDERVPTSLLGDPAKLSQILLNLTGNAVKFVQHGEIRLEVHLKEEKRKRVFLEFVVSDTGIGISNDQLKHIFDTYRQFERPTSLEYGGSGLGLSIVKEIVEKQQGCIAVSSTLGVGTTFKVILPFEKTEHKAVRRISSEKNSQQHAIAGTKVLVIEDDPITQKLMETRLAQWGCHASVTDNAQLGLELLDQQKFDVVLLDMRLPGWEGTEVARKIREKHALQLLPIIALSADIQLLETKDMHGSGINDFILKPYNSEELILKIQEHISKGNTDAQQPGKAPAIHQEAPIVDLQPIYAECLHKKELLEELLRLFELNILEFVGKTKMHLQSRNFQGVGFAAHKIKSSLKMLHAHTLLHICEELSAECRGNSSFKHLSTLFERFLTEYPKVEQAIECELNQIKDE